MAINVVRIRTTHVIHLSLLQCNHQTHETIGWLARENHLELAHQNPSTKVYWHLDNDYLGETSDVHQMELSPTKGKHRVTVVDEEGNALGVEFGVE